MPQAEIRLHVFSDYTCPFCYIGHARLIQLRQEFTLDINWCHVELHPRLPECAQGQDLCRCNTERWQSLSRHVQNLRREDGLEFTVPMNQAQSRRALLLSEQARTISPEIFEALQHGIFTAYFCDNVDIGDENLLRRLAREAGLEETHIEHAWTSQEYPDRLHQHLYLARQLGIKSAPTYVIGDQVLAGVQSLSTLRKVFHGYLQHQSHQSAYIH
ncbi:MAG: DsbA family protein [Gammaproteobacteria bacterium]|nr:DsbA family protein [Gammaproteobacteria bacterium]